MQWNDFNWGLFYSGCQLQLLLNQNEIHCRPAPVGKLILVMDLLWISWIFPWIVTYSFRLMSGLLYLSEKTLNKTWYSNSVYRAFCSFCGHTPCPILPLQWFVDFYIFFYIFWLGFEVLIHFNVVLWHGTLAFCQGPWESWEEAEWSIGVRVL